MKTHAWKPTAENSGPPAAGLPDANPFLEARQVSKIYHAGLPDTIVALQDASFEMRLGEVVALCGPSGSGKTTLLNLLAAMARPTSGRIFIGGQEITHLSERFLNGLRRRTFGFIFQQFNLIHGISALENVMLPLYPEPLKPAALRRHALALLDRLNLQHRAGVKAQFLSGGEQQRVAIARALAAGPAVIIADEPTAHLDRALASDLLNILLNLKQEGRTLLIATHDPFLRDSPLVDRIVEMQNGRITTGDRP